MDFNLFAKFLIQVLTVYGHQLELWLYFDSHYTTIRICSRYHWVVDVCSKLSKVQANIRCSTINHLLGKGGNTTISEVLTGNRTLAELL